MRREFRAISKATGKEVARGILHSNNQHAFSLEGVQNPQNPEQLRTFFKSRFDRELVESDPGEPDKFSM